MANLFKGYAQSKGFGANLVNIPDPSRKIREEGLVKMAHMKDQIAWNNKQAERLSRALDENAQIEARNRETNFNLSQEINATLANAKDRNFKSLIEQRRAGARQAEQNIKALLNLTKSGAAAYKVYEKKRKDDLDLWAHQIWDEHGIGQEKANIIQQASDETWNNSSAREAIVTKLGLDGIDAEVLQRIRKASGYRSIAIAKFEAKRWGNNTLGYYSENYNTKVQVPGVDIPVDLASAAPSQVDTVLQLLDKKRRLEAGDLAPSSKMLSLSGGYALAEQGRAVIRRRKQETAIKEAVAEQHQDEKVMILDAIGPRSDGMTSPGAGIDQLIHYYAGPNPTGSQLSSSRKRVVAGIIDGLKSGDIKWEEIRALEDYRFTPRGSTKEVRWGDHFKKEWLAIENAGIAGSKREMAVAQIEQNAQKARDTHYKNDMLDLALTESPTAETWGRMLEIATKNNWTESMAFIADQITRSGNDGNDRTAMAIAQDRIRRNEYMTNQDILDLGATTEASAKISALVKKNNAFLPTQGEDGTDKQIETWITAKLNSIIPKKSGWLETSTRNDAIRGAQSRARGYYKTARTQGFSHDRAYEYARDAITKDILDPQGLWAKKWDESTNEFVFSGFAANSEFTRLELGYEKLGTEIAADPNSIYEKAYLAKQDLMTKSGQLQRGQHPDILPRSAFLQSTTKGNIKALDFERAQIAYYNKLAEKNGTPLIPEYPKWYIDKVEKAYSTISPKAQWLLNSHNYCDINKAACASGSNPIYTKPSIDNARTVFRGIYGTESRGDYEATDKGDSVTIHGFSLTGSTIREVIKIQQNGHINSAGRYSFDAESLTQAAELSGISLDEPFDAENQDLLFDAYFKKNGPTMLKLIQDESQRLLIESVYETLTSPNLSSRYGMHNPALLRPEAYNALYNGGRYV
tara:strand:+ start:214 stop:2970 length:2757 start_codon:yes stop_codon:yes gene_type:complete